MTETDSGNTEQFRTIFTGGDGSGSVSGSGSDSSSRSR